ncbi:NAD(P)H-hydrate dehydratase [Metallumcola ferriviriculae]|uniref:Bifunctional NAD(P)H-hydrate repair enzyme n=1 Tax=Metallumcola ferriviriculae TaxID=3039180 RepID=A0AAU0UUD9_9FIRM|nr:NAD(P)H-hydrate dehydratase [Desulfitibacteraceae bacterium MK1]
MKVVTSDEMQQLDQKAIKLGIPGVILMENAGFKVVESIQNYFGGQLADKQVTIVVGKGNNGGDGLVIARHLSNSKVKVKIFLTSDPTEYSGDAATNMRIVEQMGIPVFRLEDENDLTRLNVTLLYTDMVVDAIFGTGFRGSPRGLTAQVMETVNESGVPVLAVDVPSGLDASSGKIKGVCVRADITVTFALPKLGLLVEPGVGAVGKLVVADISIPQSLLDSTGSRTEMVDLDWCIQAIPPRESTGHKGTYGHVLVIGGSMGMSGAPILAAKAALKAGAGLVTLAVPRSIQQITAAQITEILTCGVAETASGTFAAAEAAAQLQPLISTATAVVIGPGMSQGDEVGVFLAALLPKIHKPLVIDADALNIIAGLEGMRFLRSTVLTPHPGEMARLLGQSVGQVQSSRLEAVTEAVKKYGTTVLLKGARSLTATSEQFVYVNTTGNPGMATGGSGDVLAGIIGALLAQGLATEKAAAAGAYLHGLAGDEAASVQGQMGLVAGDLPEMLPRVLRRLGR